MTIIPLLMAKMLVVMGIGVLRPAALMVADRGPTLEPILNTVYFRKLVWLLNVEQFLMLAALVELLQSFWKLKHRKGNAMNDRAHDRHEVQETLRCAMTVGDLIGILKTYDEDAAVLFADDYGDYTHTIQALPVREIKGLNEHDLTVTAYSDSGIALKRDPDESCEEEDRQYFNDDYFSVPVVILNT